MRTRQSGAFEQKVTHGPIVFEPEDELHIRGLHFPALWRGHTPSAFGAIKGLTSQWSAKSKEHISTNSCRQQPSTRAALNYMFLPTCTCARAHQAPVMQSKEISPRNTFLPHTRGTSMLIISALASQSIKHCLQCTMNDVFDTACQLDQI